MAGSVSRRVASEFAGTLAALAAVTVYMQLRDPVSPLRLWVSDTAEQLRESWIRQRVDQFIVSASKEGS